MVRWFFLSHLWTFFLFGEISTIYLSWSDDPTTTMTIQWHTPSSEEDTIHLLKPEKRVAVTGIHYSFSDEPLVVHTVRLKDLLPNTEYQFQIGDDEKTYRFRTAPTNLETPIRFVVGGDLYLSPSLFRKMSEVVVKQDPLFAVLGGDLAYAIDSPQFFSHKPIVQWQHFLADWTRRLQTADGRLIPFLAVPGNHDISAKEKTLFFTLFDFKEKLLYRAIDFGSYLSLVLLDTGHASPIDGAQTQWLEKVLSKKSDVSYLFCVYHIGAYPSVYSYDGKDPTKIRKNWCPLFDRYNVQACFEHHSHAYKKTFPLKGDQKASSGTIYFGDGCWGVKPRKTHNAWYLEKSDSINHVYVVELTKTQAKVSAISIQEKLIDTTQIPAHVSLDKRHSLN